MFFLDDICPSSDTTRPGGATRGSTHEVVLGRHSGRGHPTPLELRWTRQKYEVLGYFPVPARPQ